MALAAVTRHAARHARHLVCGTSSQLPCSQLFSTTQTSEAVQGEQPVDLEQLRSTPGWLKGPVGRRVVKALGEEEWEAATDPKTGQQCWRNIKSGEVTVAGIPKPDTWTEVVDKSSGLLYYWNRRTGETTGIGEPKPGAYGRLYQSSPDSSVQGSTTPNSPSVFDMSGSSPNSDPTSQRGPKAKEPSLLQMLNTPSGYMFMGLSFVAFVVPWVQDWITAPGDA